MIPAAICAAVLQTVRENEKQDIELIDSRRASGGCINQAWHLTFSNGLHLFLKYNPDAPADLFHCEARGLAALEVKDGVRVPRRYHNSSGQDDQHFLILEDISADDRIVAAYCSGSEALGRQLAVTHRLSVKQFGGPGDMSHNYLGPTLQSNPLSDSWADFFIQHRLLYMLQLMETRGISNLEEFHRFLPRAHTLLAQHSCEASTVHGDMWNGNVLFTPGDEPVLIDPAAYNGDREVDIAMTQLFGGFDKAFYSAYDEVWPLPDGWRERQDIYNLYHVLHHALLFGGGYLSQGRSLIKRFV